MAEAENNQGQEEKINCTVDVTDSGPWKKKISVQIPREQIDKELDSQYGELVRTAEVPGFRKGHAPRRLVEKRFGEDKWLMIFSQLSLPVIDLLWMEHLVDMDQLREGIGLRGYAQRDPMVEYKNEGHFRFEALVTRVYKDIAERLLRIEDARVVERGSQEDKARALSYTRGELESGVSDERSYIEASAEGGGAVAGVPGISGSPPSAGRYKVEEVKSGQPKVGRNEPCPCGSGKKFKNCHGKQP